MYDKGNIYLLTSIYSIQPHYQEAIVLNHPETVKGILNYYILNVFSKLMFFTGEKQKFKNMGLHNIFFGNKYREETKVFRIYSYFKMSHNSYAINYLCVNVMK